MSLTFLQPPSPKSVSCYLITFFPTLQRTRTFPLSSLVTGTLFSIPSPSMGGGIAVHVANDPSIRDRIRGLIVVDVVEGTALESLPVMMGVLRKRPTEFYCYEDAIDWRYPSNLFVFEQCRHPSPA